MKQYENDSIQVIYTFLSQKYQCTSRFKYQPKEAVFPNNCPIQTSLNNV